MTCPERTSAIKLADGSVLLSPAQVEWLQLLGIATDSTVTQKQLRALVAQAQAAVAALPSHELLTRLNSEQLQELQALEQQPE